MLKSLKSLSPRQKQIALALAGASVLALIALLSRRKAAGGAAAAAEDPTGGAPAPIGSTFADNGEAAAGLSTAITGGLGEVALGLGRVDDALAGLTADRNATTASIDAAIPAIGIADAVPLPAVAAPAAVAQAAVNRTSRPVAGAHTQTVGKRAGLDYKVVIKGGKKLRFYESKKGAGDFGKKPGTKISVGAASKPKAPAKAKAPAKKKAPAAKAKAPAKKAPVKAKAPPKKSTPSKKTAATPRAPAPRKRR